MSKASKKSRSAAQSSASRANGAKSQGPATSAGKAKVSSNRMSHGFRANNIPLANENREAYTTHHEAYIARYTPIDKVEDDLVGLLATNMWQLMRINSMEVALFDLEMAALEPEIARDYKTMDEYGRLALAFKKSAGDNALELLRRYKSTAERAYHRALQAIEQIQKDRTPPKTAHEENKTTVQTQESPQTSVAKHLLPLCPAPGIRSIPQPVATGSTPLPTPARKDAA